MTAMTEAGDRRLRPFQRLLAALTDPARRERSMAAALLGYAAAWTLYAVIAKAGQDVHFDMAEQYALGQQLAFGHDKHPPLGAAVVRAWFSVFPRSDWAYYLLAVASATLALWLIWRICARFLDGEKRVIAIALLTLVPFFNFHALKFNQNTLLLPLWAATTLAFLRSFETRRVRDAALAGAAAAAAMYGKYWSVFLIAGLGLAALLDPRRGGYFRSPAPWVTIAVGAVALIPHLAWLVTHDFAPLAYASARHGAPSTAAVLVSVLGYVAGSLGYVAVPLVIALAAMRPGRAALADMLWPATLDRRLAAVAFWATLLAPVPVAIAASFHLGSLWTMPAWSLLPVVLLSSPLTAIAHAQAVRIVALAALFPLFAVIASPAVAIAIHHMGVTPAAAHSSLLAPAVERLWRETTDRPLRLFSSYEDLNYGVAFYLASGPRTVNALDGIPERDLDGRIERDGIALVCPLRAEACVANADARASRAPAGKRMEVEVARSFIGAVGRPARYLIIAIPPVHRQRSDT